ncbi:MAG: hypothetical protein EA360_01000 [Balneolaceae bacterium]|nr:MAG: hypothetical protein EA360_01000 [Balneolaceae bacterium]
MVNRILVFTLLLFSISAIRPGQSTTAPEFIAESLYADENTPVSDRVKELVDHFQRQNLDLESLLEDSRFELYDGIGDRFRNSAERRVPDLEEYKRILGFNDKRNRIVGFMNDHSAYFARAEEEYQIPATVIAAIIGVESDYGRNIGRFNPLNVYVSMYHENYRADFAKAQLEELLKFTSRLNIDVFSLKSSYAGAMSFAQFIPYSVNRWWVGDDLFSMENNILSIANYLAHFKGITGTIEGAVFRYNPSSLYRDAVMALSHEAELLLQGTQ